MTRISDAFLLLTPLLALGVLALVRFIGCDAFYGLHHGPDINAPEGLVARPGDHKVDLSWDAVDGADGYQIDRGAVSGQYTSTFQVGASQTTFTDAPLVNGVTQFYVVAGTQGGDAGPSTDEVAATPGQGFVVTPTFGTLRNNFSGFAGMVIQIGAAPITVVGLGRIFVSGNSGTHVVKIADGVTGTDIAGAFVTVDFSTGGTPNQFAYAILPAPVVLNPNTEYYLVAQETNGGDQFFDLDTSVIVNPVATVVAAAFQDSSGTFVRGGGPGHTYGPVDFLF
jgi:hypothetical protein